MISTINQVRMQSFALPILVLFKMALRDSPTYRSFRESAQYAGVDPVGILVYDNSPERQVSSVEEKGLLAYKHDPNNGGIVAAYNWALDIASSRGAEWLLLLDQDSELPVGFIDSLRAQIRLYEHDHRIVAIVPVVHSGGAVISPLKVDFNRNRPLDDYSPRIQTTEVTAINSGAAIRGKFVRSIGGFHRGYRLDFLDHWLFRQIYGAGTFAAIAGSIDEHALSVLDYRNNISLARYRSILTGEMGFITTYKSKSEIQIYFFRLLARAAMMLVHRRTSFAMMTMGAACNLAMHPTRSFEERSE